MKSIHVNQYSPYLCTILTSNKSYLKTTTIRKLYISSIIIVRVPFCRHVYLKIAAILV